ncbi:MAG: ADP-ribosylglycohydrolase family protein [bacterium]
MNADPSKFEGCLLGLAIGDALGMPFEGLRAPWIVSKLGHKVDDFYPGKENGLRAGQWTDDTKMALQLARSIIRSGGRVDSADIARAYLEWFDTGDLRGIGHTTIESILRLKKGALWSESGKTGEYAAGNGTAMRCAPIGLLFCDKPDKLKDESRADAIITHNNEEAVAGSRAINFFVARGVCQNDLKEASPALIDECVKFIGPCKVAERLALAKKLLLEGVATGAAIHTLGTGGYVVETVASAVFCFLKTPGDFETTAISAVMGGEDADTTAAVAGAISGAWNGTWGIPLRWIERVEDSAEIRSIAGKLFNCWQSEK